MDGVISLVIDFEGNKLVQAARHNIKFDVIKSAVLQKWSNRLGDGFKLRYSVVDGVDNCYLENDEEVESMLIVAQQLGVKLVTIRVLSVGCVAEPNSSGNCCGNTNSVNHTKGTATDLQSNGSSPHSFNQLAGNAFARNSLPPYTEDQPLTKVKKSMTPAYEKSNTYPRYDMCPSHERKPLLSDPWGNIITGIGQEFGSPEDFRIKLCKYATINGFKYIFNQNSRERIYVVCKKRFQSEACTWFIRSSKVKGGNGEMCITDADLNHTCEIVVGAVETQRLGAEFLSKLIDSDVRENPKMGGKDVKRLLKKAYGIDITYKQAWRALESARDKIFGSFENSFDQLRWYLEALLKTNPGSVVKLEQNKETGRFERAFIAFKATLDGFKHCRPMLFIDGTFMRGRWKGTVLAATAKDGNDGLYPVAFAMVQGETTANWKWFLELLRDHVRHEKPIYYISDRNTGLLSAFTEVWEHPLNFYCLVHLFNNLKGLFGPSKTESEKIKLCGLLKRCAYAPSRRMFDAEMAEFIKVGGDKAEQWISNIEKEKWTVAYAPGLLRYGEMTSNAAESFNHWIKDARALPITFMVDCIRIGIMGWFVERREAAARWTSRLTESMQTTWNNESHICMHWGVLKGPSGTYEVFSTPNGVVNMDDKTCSCYQWQVVGFPCVHAIAVTIKHYKGISGIVHEYYFKDSYMAAYKGDIQSVPETEKFEFLNIAGLNPVLPPVKIAQRGRTKQKRIPSFGEFPRKKPWVCKKCGLKGRHDEVTCGSQT